MSRKKKDNHLTVSLFFSFLSQSERVCVSSQLSLSLKVHAGARQRAQRQVGYRQQY